MQLRILGPLELWHGGRLVALAPKQRVVLAALLLRANRVAPAGWLVEQVWGDAPPATATKTLQSLVLRLRHVLPTGTVVTRPPGYLLEVAPDQLDILVFRQLAHDAAVAAGSGDHGRAAEHWRQALALWRGQALADVDAESLHRDEVPALEELRLGGLEACIDAELRLGRHAHLIAELSGLVAAHPLRERFWAQLVLALYRSGRRADALTTYQDARKIFVAELGVGPTRALQNLQHQILNDDPVLDLPSVPVSGTLPVARAVLTADPSLGPPEPDPPAAAARSAVPTAGTGGPPPSASVSAPAVRPRQLPPDIASFVGRERELAALECLLGQAGPGGSMVIVAIDGAAGVGKSALANHAAHRLASQFPDGQLYVDLRGDAAGPAPLRPGEVLGRFLRALGADGRHLPAQPEERVGLLRSLLAERRLLVVLDNAATAAQVRLLLPASPTCAALITSRRHLAELDGAVHLHLDLLGADESVALLARLAGPHRVAAEPAASAEVTRLCGRLPLALRIAGARLAARPAWSVDTLAERLRDQRLRLDELELDGLAVRASLQLAYRELRDGPPTSVDAARAFRLLALLDGAEIGVSVAAAVLDQPAQAAGAAL
jgi:DNA-binding SARP family transcriptional activator